MRINLIPPKSDLQVGLITERSSLILPYQATLLFLSWCFQDFIINCFQLCVFILPIIIACRTKKLGNIGFNVFSLNTPEDDVTTIYQPDGTGEKWKASDISISISYGRKLSNNFSIGSNLKFIQQ